MKNPEWTLRIVARYALLQLPGVAFVILLLILVRRWVALPAWLIGCLVGAWVLKDVVLFPFLWRAYDRKKGTAADLMIGARGVAQEPLAPAGYVRVRGELWHAELDRGEQPVLKGGSVRVRGIRGLTLLVECDDEKRSLQGERPV